MFGKFSYDWHNGCRLTLKIMNIFKLVKIVLINVLNSRTGYVQFLFVFIIRVQIRIVNE